MSTVPDVFSPLKLGPVTLRNRIIKRLDTAQIEAVQSLDNYSRDVGGRKTAAFRVDFGIEGEKINDKLRFTPASVSSTYFGFPINHIIKESDVVETMMPYFGTKSCKTYFCKREKVTSEVLSWVRRQIQDEDIELEKVLLATKERIKLQALEMVADGTVARCQQSWYEDEAVEKIRNALLAFKDVGPEVIKRALDEFVVHEVCNC